ncbi:MAG: tetratricopeptide repeat protein [Bacteroidota bacterium]
MIGRREELDILVDMVRSAGAAAQSVVFVTGEAGIGKTTLLKAVQKECENLQVVFASAECSTPVAGHDIGEVEALKPWADIIDSLARDNSAEKKKRKFDIGKFMVDTAPAWVTMIPVLGPSVGAALDILGAGYNQVYMNKMMAREQSSGAANQQQIFQQYINLLLKLSDSTPLVIILDDFHWADTSSCNLLFAAARQLQGKPITFLIAYRPDDAGSSRGGEGHPLLHIKTEFERYDLCRDVQIPKFTASNLDALLHRRYPNYQNNDKFEEWLAHVGGGNALFITEFLNTLEEDGYINRETGIFSDEYKNVKVPASAYAVVSERIRRLNEDNRELLRYASVEGETFTANILSKTTEIPQLKILQKLRLLEETHRVLKSLGKQILYSKESTAYQFSHTLLHRAMYETLGEEERELLHEAILDVLKNEWSDALESGTNLAGISARIAVHANIAKDHIFAAEVLLKGAESSWREYAESEALQKISLALQSLENVKKIDFKTNALRGELYFLKAEIHRHRARYAEALEEFLKAGNIFKEISLEELFLKTQLGMSGVYWLQSEFLKAEEIAREVLLKASEKGFLKEKSMALNLLGNVALRSGEYDVAFKNYDEVLKIQQELSDHYGEAMALSNLGVTYIQQDRFEMGLEYYEKALKILQQENYRQAQATLLNNIANVYSKQNEFLKARPYYEQSLDICRISGDRFGEAAFLNNIGSTFLYMNEPLQALEHYEASLRIKQEIGDKRGETETLMNIGQAYYELQKFTEAGTYLHQSISISNEIGYAAGKSRAEALLKEIREHA